MMKILDMKNPEFFNHIEESKEPMPGIAINRDAFLQAQQDTLAEARSPWAVIQDNVKTCAVILVVQVSVRAIAFFQSIVSLLIKCTCVDKRHHSWIRICLTRCASRRPSLLQHDGIV